MTTINLYGQLATVPHPVLPHPVSPYPSDPDLAYPNPRTRTLPARRTSNLFANMPKANADSTHSKFVKSN